MGSSSRSFVSYFSSFSVFWVSLPIYCEKEFEIATFLMKIRQSDNLMINNVSDC